MTDHDTNEKSNLTRVSLLCVETETQHASVESTAGNANGENGGSDSLKHLQESALEFRRQSRSGEIVAPTAPLPRRQPISNREAVNRVREQLEKEEQARREAVEREASESPFATIAAQQQRIEELETALTEIYDGIEDENRNGYFMKQIAAKALMKE